MVLPGSLTYRTYGYLMVAYAVEKQWGAVVELALVRIAEDWKCMVNYVNPSPEPSLSNPRRGEKSGAPR